LTGTAQITNAWVDSVTTRAMSAAKRSASLVEEWYEEEADTLEKWKPVKRR